MKNELLIEAGPHETRVAILEDGQLVEVHIERLDEPAVVGSIYMGRVSRVVPGIQAAFVDIGLDRDAFLFAGDLQRTGPVELSNANAEDRHRPIADQIQQGQELLVQGVKESLPGKGARISSQISIPGRFLVLLPGSTGVGVSRRIEAPSERQRLEESVRAMMPMGDGVIVRTAAENGSEEELRQDLDWLNRTWQEVQKKAAGIQAPERVHGEENLALRAARDLLDESCAEVWIEGPSAYAAVESYLSDLDQDFVPRLRLHEGESSLFERRGVDAAIAKAMRTRVWLKSGGHLVINPTEALVAIDVNSGRNTEASELEATALQTNLEAAVESARQIRLRDLAGIIVVDFIDLMEPDNRAELVDTFAGALGRDRTRIQVSEMSDFGLVAVTRKRMRGGVRQRLTQVCPCCAGEGRIKDAATIGLELDRALRKKSDDVLARGVRVRLNSRTKTALEETQDKLLAAIQREVGVELELAAADDLGLDEFEIQTK
jgi:ribonuclease G